VGPRVWHAVMIWGLFVGRCARRQFWLLLQPWDRHGSDSVL